MDLSSGILDATIFYFIIAGFLAQMVDGSLGMAYGVSSNSLLLSLGVPPAAASASVHTAEVFTTAVSGLSHWKFGNIDKELMKKLAIPGVLGGITGAYILANISGNFIKPFISVYLILMGVRILLKAFKKALPEEVREHLPTPVLVILGLLGGGFDALGGGGWGPIVTTTLIAEGTTPRKAIGTVNLSEFFVTFAEAATFIATIGLVNPSVILGLIIGGVIAAPLGAFLTKKIPTRLMMIVVGLLICGLNIRTLVLSLM